MPIRPQPPEGGSEGASLRNERSSCLVRIHIGHHQRIEHEAALLPLSATHQSLQHDQCPKVNPALPRLAPRLAFNRSSMPLWTNMRKRQKQSFSLIPLPPSCSPATLPPPSYLSFKTSSSNLIAVAAAMRDYQIGSARQSTSSTHFRPLLVKVLVSYVSVTIFLESVT